MSGPLVSASAAFVAKNSRIPPYAIEQSLRFDGSSYLNLAGYGQNPTDGYRGTISIWVKNDAVKYGGDGYIITATRAGSTSNLYHERNSTTGFEFVNLGVFGGTNPSVRTGGKYRDYSAWHHIVVHYFNDTGANLNNGYKIWVNGVQDDSTRAGGWSVQNNWAVTENATSTRQLGRSGSAYFGGYMAECHCIDGQNVAPTDFGEFDESGVWRPIEYQGTYGNNGWYLKFDPSAANGVGHDHSGNGHHFTDHGFDTTNSTASTYDVMSDTPTTNWCTLNPLVIPGNTAISDGNLTYSTSIAEHALSTFGVTEGKWYCEVTLGGANCFLGLVNSTHYRLSYIGSTTLFAVADNNSEYSPNSTRSFSSLSSFTTSDVIGFALDATNKTCDVYKNNSKVLTYDTFTLDGPYFFSFDRNAPSPSVTHTVNFGQRAFAYTPPTGFKALNTKNLPAPTVKDGSDYFNTILWAGDNANPRTLTGVGFQPDWVWLKDRTQSTNHRLVDAVRGAGNTLKSNLTSAETSSEIAGTITAFTSDGFTVEGTSNVEGVNLSGDNFVAWNWLAGGSGSSNTDGTITSTVSVNPSAGFSIVSYTASGTDNDTVGHGLGVEPALHIVKSRDGARDWLVYTREIDGSLDFLRLNTTAAAANSSANAPTSTVFSIYGADINTAGEDCIAYCFAEVEGYSKFGIWVGNLNADGPFIYTGFLPAFIMWKRNGVDGWVMKDSVRNTYNTVTTVLYANLTNAESSTQEVDFLSNGFKIRTNSGASNALGDTYIYMAFASNPFGGSGVNPATAR